MRTHDQPSQRPVATPTPILRALRSSRAERCTELFSHIRTMVFCQSLRQVSQAMFSRTPAESEPWKKASFASR